MSHTVQFLIQTFQTGGGYFLGACKVCCIAEGGGGEEKARMCELANAEDTSKREKKNLQRGLFEIQRSLIQ